jgi:hypothetical protein
MLIASKLPLSSPKPCLGRAAWAMLISPSGLMHVLRTTLEFDFCADSIGPQFTGVQMQVVHT